jgi:hypothetical protein
MKADVDTFERTRKIQRINEIALEKLEIRMLNRLCAARARVRTLETANVITVLEQRARQVRSDKASSPQDETPLRAGCNLTTGMAMHIRPPSVEL